MHKHFLLAALEQARLGRGHCAPNPAVGAVAVYNDQIVAQAFHSGAGLPHAERELLQQLPEVCTDTVIYVTLEPCNHWGRTPPCVDGLIERRVHTVVFAYRDPNPLVADNNTTKRLQAQGIQVVYYPVSEIDAFYESYAYWLRTGLPWVTVKMAQTFDGHIAGPQGQPVMLSNLSCANFTHQQRAWADVILTTAQTINQDDPALNVRQLGETHAKVVAILDRQGRLNPDAKIFSTSKRCLIYHEAIYPVHQLLSNRCDLFCTPSQASGLDLLDVLRHLGQLGFHDVWVEAGATLFRALHRERLVNRTYLYLVPRVLGTEAIALYQDLDIFEHGHQVQWRVMDDNVMAIFNWSLTCSPV